MCLWTNYGELHLIKAEGDMYGSIWISCGRVSDRSQKRPSWYAIQLMLACLDNRLGRRNITLALRLRWGIDLFDRDYPGYAP